ncbi:T-complex 10 C-terminal domain-containing protein [Halomonas salifodinae]|uniref:T-complex 10 C-terminal domain-containing protein n=1 Tax=Halomonas salifodinae TaxID=438745 RepID=UPI0033A0BEF8
MDDRYDSRRCDAGQASRARLWPGLLVLGLVAWGPGQADEPAPPPLLVQLGPALEELSPRLMQCLARCSGVDEARLREPGLAPETPGERRRILEDGTFETRYPDGRIHRQFPDGSTTTHFPDGTSLGTLPMQVPSAELPLLPDELAAWGGELGERLLGVLGNLLGDAEFEAYRQTEAGKGYYEVIDWRLRSLRFLTATP